MFYVEMFEITEKTYSEKDEESSLFLFLKLFHFVIYIVSQITLHNFPS